jgi:hypothetical protein
LGFLRQPNLRIHLLKMAIYMPLAVVFIDLNAIKYIAKVFLEAGILNGVKAFIIAYAYFHTIKLRRLA